MNDNPDAAGTPPGDPDGSRRSRARRVPGSVANRDIAGKRRLRKRHTVAKVIVATLVVLAIGTATSVVLAYNNWNNNLDRKDVSKQLKNRPPEQPTEAINVLVLGSDTREGENNIDGLTGDGERSDTTILLHLSADRKRAYGISIPRDTLVDRPTCYDEDENPIPGAKDVMWNEAFSVGGAACTIQQFEQITDIRIDNYVVIDFQGFKDMVNALDGVEVCIPEDIEDPEHGITLEAGTREIRDDEALSYVRVRHVGDGTDPQRIRRQQAFMAAMINKAVSAGMLVRPDRMLSFLNAVTGSIQTDYSNIAELAKLGGSFQGIGLDNIKFVTTPWVYSTAQVGRVEWTDDVDDLWELVLGDKPLSQQFAEDSISAADDPEGSSVPQHEASEDPSTDATEPTDGGGKKDRDQGLSDDERENAGLCT